jgi:dinuclear metal center YbgI/SA1388 family protein
MQQLDVIVDYCNTLLRVNEFSDYCPNGLQIEGRAEVRRLICGVTACQALIDRAIEQQADAILVHHGYFWKNEAPAITGIKRQRIGALLENGISLLAYHLPLDAHDTLGNNVTLSEKLGLQVEEVDSGGLLWSGQLTQSMQASAFAQHIAQRLGREPLHLPAGSGREIKRVGWCTGGAQHYIEQAAAQGLDAYISGEVSEQTFHLAQELDIHYFAAGHHATESYGVQALAGHLAEKFALHCEFIDIPNPV